MDLKANSIVSHCNTFLSINETPHVCSCHVKYAFQGESTLYIAWMASDYNWTRTQYHLARKRTLNHLAKLPYKIFLVSSGKMIFLFPENMILFFRQKRKYDPSQKIPGNLMFLQISWKDGLSEKFAPEHDLFCNIWKDDTSFFSENMIFFL